MRRDIDVLPTTEITEETDQHGGTEQRRTNGEDKLFLALLRCPPFLRFSVLIRFLRSSVPVIIRSLRSLRSQPFPSLTSKRVSRRELNRPRRRGHVGTAEEGRAHITHDAFVIGSVHRVEHVDEEI